MQVDNNSSISSILQKSQEGKSAQSPQVTAPQGQSQQSQPTGQTDTVTLTQAAAQLHQIEQHIRSAPVTDTHRVEQVKSALETGSYDPDPAQVADKMLSFESGLNGSRSLR